jgi:hypothetical protein
MSVSVSHIEPEAYRNEIQALLSAVSLPGCEVLTVESVQKWAHTAGIREDNPSRAAMAVRRDSDGKPTIILARRITSDMHRSVIGALEIRGFFGAAMRLADLRLFLEHVVLHEARHLLEPDATESDCDRWDFAQMKARFTAG